MLTPAPSTAFAQYDRKPWDAQCQAANQVVSPPLHSDRDQLFSCFEPLTHMVQLWLLQGEAVRPAPVGVALQHKHGHLPLGAHDDHVGVSHGAVHDWRTEIHGDEVQLVHCKAKPQSDLTPPQLS